ncbi:4a-hydroxytetrahydrobiopterin dehydratase [Pelagibacteraceae bacterium]|nr:4a-hydroxytetrahydrobiopterin dehydratase [Pelagibacteraceae bacterium]
MSDLSKKKCIACDGSIPPFDTSEMHKYLKKVDGWDVKSDDDKSFYLIKGFKFKNFVESQNFVNRISNISEEENHHPDISFGWGYCKVKIFTHAIKGLVESDFILAAKIDKID